MIRSLTGASSLLSGLPDDAIGSLSDEELLNGLEALAVQMARLAAFQLALRREAHRRGLDLRLRRPHSTYIHELPPAASTRIPLRPGSGLGPGS